MRTLIGVIPAVLISTSGRQASGATSGATGPPAHDRRLPPELPEQPPFRRLTSEPSALPPLRPPHLPRGQIPRRFLVHAPSFREAPVARSPACFEHRR